MTVLDRIRWLFGWRPPHPRGACFYGCERCPPGRRPWERLYALGGRGPREVLDATAADDLRRVLLEPPTDPGWRPLVLEADEDLVRCECVAAPPVLRGPVPALDVRLGPWAPFEDESVVECVRALETRTDELRRVHVPIPCPLHPAVRP